MPNITSEQQYLPYPDYIEEFVGEVFIHVAEDDIYDWQGCADLVAELAELVFNSANRIGGVNRKAIKRVIFNLFMESEKNIEIPARLILLGSMDGSGSDNIREKIDNALQIIKKCTPEQLDDFLTELFSETDKKILSDCLRMFREEIHVEYDLKYLSDWFAIYRFLADTELIFACLTAYIEKNLQRYAAELQGQIPVRDGYFRLPENPNNVYARHKVLSGFLYKWAAENGFAQNAKLVRNLKQDTFFSLLRAKSFFKDCAVFSTNHGVWSHALQWYLIFQHNKKFKLLINPPMEVYQSLGADSHKDIGKLNRSLWNALLDRTSGTNFTCPEFITRTIVDVYDHQRWPLLSATFVRSRDKILYAYGSAKAYALHVKDKHKNEEKDGVVLRPFKKT